jgi:hypothetical protein
MSSRLPRLRSIAAGVLAVAVPAALAVAVAAPAASARTHGHDNEFRQTNLVSDLTTVGAQIVDPNLKNPWGVSFANRESHLDFEPGHKYGPASSGDG